MTTKTMSDMKVIDLPEYVAICDDYIDLMNAIKKQMQGHVSLGYIQKSASDRIEVIKQNMMHLGITKKQELEQALEDMRFNFKPELPDDPAAMMIQRQDIELKFQYMSDIDLIDYTKHLNRYQPDVFALQQLKNNVEQRLDGSRQQQALSYIEMYKQGSNVGEEYKNTPEYQTTEEILSELGMATSALIIRRSRYPKELAYDSNTANEIDKLDKGVKFIDNLVVEIDNILRGYSE